MNLIGNIIWVIFGGFLLAVEYVTAGIALCITIVGIPFGLQAFKLGIFALLPFGQQSVPTIHDNGCLYAVMNIIWLIIGGVWIALTHLILGALFCITIIGIPFGMQHFKLMSVALTPFGRTIIPS